MANNDSSNNTSDIVLVDVITQKCTICNKNMNNKDPKITCNACKGNFHFTCAKIIDKNLRTESTKKNNWKCSSCSTKRMTPNNTSTPKKETKHINIEALNASIEFLRNAVEKLTEATNEFKEEVNSLKQEVKYLYVKINIIEQDKLNKDKKITEIEERLNTLENNENNIKEKHINELEIKLNNIEQIQLKKNVEIVIEKNNSTSVLETVKQIARASNITIQDSDVTDAYRIKNNKIIVKFSSLCIKKHFMKRVRECRLKEKDINKETNNMGKRDETIKNNKNIYINDQLTAYNAKLYWMTKNKVKEMKWRFSWIKEGKIFAKKEENSSAVVINSTEEIYTKIK